jgi:hypothetical protein
MSALPRAVDAGKRGAYLAASVANGSQLDGAPMKGSTGTLGERMRGKGLRMTGQRQLLVEVLEEATEHLDAEALFKRAKAKDPTIHRATIYRTLNRLKKLGLVDELDLMRQRRRHYYESGRPRFTSTSSARSARGCSSPKARSGRTSSAASRRRAASAPKWSASRWPGCAPRASARGAGRRTRDRSEALFF